ncbi:MAG: Bug family tripartite tricarboxylate transporter substrate binding protein [Pigmentiphaga sp.]
MKRTSLTLAVALLAATATISFAHAEYPEKPIRMIVGFAAGGTTDILARDVAEELGKKLGQTVIVENRPGVGGNIGNAFVAKAKPDGHTILFASNSIAIATSVYPNLGYDPLKDLEPVTLVASVPNVMAIPATLPVKTVSEYLDMARQTPNSVTYASAGNGSVAHLSGALLSSIAKVPLQHIPYKGNADATTDLIAGRVHANFNQINALIPLIEGEKLKALAIVSKERSALLPDVPTMSEQGFPEFDLVPWFGVFAPEGTPKPIVDRLAKEIDGIVNSDYISKRWASTGATGMGGSPEDFGRLFRSDAERLGRLAQEAGAKVN